LLLTRVYWTSLSSAVWTNTRVRLFITFLFDMSWRLADDDDNGGGGVVVLLLLLSDVVKLTI